MPAKPDMYCEFCFCKRCAEYRSQRSVGQMTFPLGDEVIRLRSNIEVNIVVFNLVESGFDRQWIAKQRKVSTTMIGIKYWRGKRASTLKSRPQDGAQPSEVFLLPTLTSLAESHL